MPVSKQFAFVRSLIVYPLVLGDKLVGIIILYSSRKDQFTRDDLVKLNPYGIVSGVMLESGSGSPITEEDAALREQCESQCDVDENDTCTVTAIPRVADRLPWRSLQILTTMRPTDWSGLYVVGCFARPAQLPIRRNPKRFVSELWIWRV